MLGKAPAKKGDRLTREEDEFKFIHLRFKRGQVVGFRKARRQGHVPRVNDGSWDRVRGLGS